MTALPEPSDRRMGWIAAWLACLLLAALAASAAASTVMLTGQVRVLDAEPILVPPSDISPTTLSYLIPEGTVVKAGDVLVRVDPGQSLAAVQAAESQIELGEARRDKELAELKVKVIDARIALVQARAIRDKAEVDAQIPREHLSGLDFDRYAGEYERARREFDLKQDELVAAEAAVRRRQADAELELRKLHAQLEFHRYRVEVSEQHATRAGTVRFGFDSRLGQRYSEGMSSQPGRQIGEVAGTGAVGVRAFALEPERNRLVLGQAVTLHFDALAGLVSSGRIERISGAPEGKAEWGYGRYFEIDIVLDDPSISQQLLAGMSVRVDAQDDDAVATTEDRP